MTAPQSTAQGERRAKVGRLAQHFVDSVRRMPSHTEYPVRVAVEGPGYRGVAKEVLDKFRVDATLQEQGRAGVPQVVPADVGTTSACESGKMSV